MSQYVLCSVRRLAMLAAVTAFIEVVPAPGIGEDLPPGLSDTDPMVRLLSVQEAERTMNQAAVPKLAAMAKEDPFDSVREAACKALETLKATDRIELLSEIAATDSSAGVRSAAAEAVKGLGGMLLEEDKAYRKPSVETLKPQKQTRRLALGAGTMGGYGVISMDVRGRFATSLSFLPWIGVEIGGGWTPDPMYVVTAGPVERINNDEHENLIFTAAGAVLLYPHRMHYAALRGGWDIGRGGYGVLAYGLEVLNDEGFFSWGVEAGILIQPGIGNWIENLCEGDDCGQELWPVIPCVRFSLQFYPI